MNIVIQIHLLDELRERLQEDTRPLKIYNAMWHLYDDFIDDSGQSNCFVCRVNTAITETLSEDFHVKR